MSIRLHINIDHVATIRNARGTPYPDPVQIASVCEQSGADGITAHLREDRRHIRDDDIERLRQSLKTVLNLECAATDEMLRIAQRVKPDVITLVPERREERTTEGGLDVIQSRSRIEEFAQSCASAGTKLSLFIEPDEQQIRVSQELGAGQIELHTGEYCLATEGHKQRCLNQLQRAARIAAEDCGLDVAAGHGLTQHNVGPVAAIPQVMEFNIGHAVVADAIEIGMAAAVRAFRAAIERGAESRRP